MFSDLIALLEPLGYTVYDTDVPGTPTFPYIVIWGGTANPHREQSLASQADGVDDLIRVTVAAGTTEGVRIAHKRVRDTLQPNGFPITVDGFFVKIKNHLAPQVDRDETITGTNRHPSFCVDVYRVQR